jgi:hypothetical protein
MASTPELEQAKAAIKDALSALGDAIDRLEFADRAIAAAEIRPNIIDLQAARAVRATP